MRVWVDGVCEMDPRGSQPNLWVVHRELTVHVNVACLVVEFCVVTGDESARYGPVIMEASLVSTCLQVELAVERRL